MCLITLVGCISLDIAKEITQKEIDHNQFAKIECKKEVIVAICIVNQKDQISKYRCTNEVCNKIK